MEEKFWKEVETLRKKQKQGGNEKLSKSNKNHTEEHHQTQNKNTGMEDHIMKILREQAWPQCPRTLDYDQDTNPENPRARRKSFNRN